MVNREVKNKTQAVQMIAPVNQTINNTTVAGGGIDVSGCDAVTVYADIGVWGDTVAGGFMEFVLQESDTVGSGYTDVANADLTDTVTLTSTVTGGSTTGGFAKVTATSDDVKVVGTGYKGTKNFIRVKINGEKNLATGTPIAVTAVKDYLRQSPV